MLSTLIVIILPLLIFVAIYYYYPLFEIPSPEDDDSALDDRNLRTQFNRAPTSAIKDLLKSKSIPKSIDSRTRRLFNAYTLKFKLPQEDKKLSAAYIVKPEEEFNKNFVTGGVPKIKAIATYGINLMSSYVKEGNTEYRKITEDLIKRVDVALKDDTLIAKQDWYNVAVLLTRLLATYEFLGTEETIKNICHQRILMITPKFNISLGTTRKRMELVWVAVPWIVTNYLYNNLSGLQETPDEFRDLEKFMNGVDVVRRGETGDGLYQECSFIYKQVATYWPLVETGEFYFGIFRARELDVGLENVIKGILNQVLHPKMDFVPLGLFGRAPKVTCDETLARQWPNYTREPELKIRVWPISGLGVFKSERFAFWLRVQRNDIAAYESDLENFEYAPGWIQMRKLYQVARKDEYKTTLTRKELSDQPGVIYYADDKDDDFERFKPAKGDFIKTYFSTVLESHIGHLGDERALYWWNKYKFDFYGRDTVIDERGVCTDNGLVVRLEVSNQSGRTLRVRTKDKNSGDMIFKCNVGGVENYDGIVTVNDKAVTVIDWRQVYDDNNKDKDKDKEVKQVIINADGNLAFEIGSDQYSMYKNNQDHFIINDKDEAIVYYSSNMNLESSVYKHKDITYRFELDIETYTYKRIIEI